MSLIYSQLICKIRHCFNIVNWNFMFSNKNLCFMEIQPALLSNFGNSKSIQTISLQIMSIFVHHYAHQFLYFYIISISYYNLFNRLRCANRIDCYKYFSERYKRDILFVAQAKKMLFGINLMGFCSFLFSQFYFETRE